MREKVNYVLVGLLSIVVFVGVAQVAQLYQDDLQRLMSISGVFAPFTYIGITISSIVFAPLGSGFLVPVAANAFGPFLAAVYSVFGWFAGSVIAFYLAREYGHGRIKQLKVCKRIREIEKDTSDIHLFVLLILLRTALPVDVFSYVLGLFSIISYQVFIWTTLIGITPFAFLFSYSSVLSVGYQVAVSVFSTVVFLYAVFFLNVYHKK